MCGTSAAIWHANSKLTSDSVSGSFIRRNVGIDFIERYGATIVLHYAAMKALQAARLGDSTGMRDDADLLMHHLGVVGYTLGLVADDQSALQSFIMRRNACRTGILVALKRLNTTKRKHKAPRRLNKVRTDTQRHGRLSGRDQFAAGNYADPAFQPVLVQYVNDQRQALANWQPYAID